MSAETRVPVRPDELVAEFGLPVRPPAIRRRDVVLVTGPWLAGSTSVVAALRERLCDVEFVEADELRPGEAPIAVVFVVSAAAPLCASDCTLLDAVAAHTDPVIGVVSKIDLHRTWRETLDTNRQIAATHLPRYRRLDWVSVAAAPDLGESRIDGLVDKLTELLADERIDKRNQLRAWEFRIQSSVADYESGAAGRGRRARAATLRELRAELAREGRSGRSVRAVELRGRAGQARMQLAHFARNRCASLRTELSEDAAELTRRTVADYPARLRHRFTVVTAEVDAGITRHLADAAAELDLPAEPPAPPPDVPEVTGPSTAAQRLESRLMLLLGAGFGLGVALTLSRLFAGLAPGLTAAAAVLGVLIGTALTIWVVSARRLLAQRAALDRWAGEAVGALRATLDETVATRVLAAERDWAIALAEQAQARDARIVEQVRAVDAELREHALARARATADRDQVVPGLRRALAAVRAELGDPEPAG